jgi:hypothetical protein
VVEKVSKKSTEEFWKKFAKYYSGFLRRDIKLEIL